MRRAGVWAVSLPGRGASSVQGCVCVRGGVVCAGASQTFTCRSAIHRKGCRNADSEEVGLGGGGEEEMK